MLKDYSSLIEEYRMKNGLSMQDICGDYISHSSYLIIPRSQIHLSSRTSLWIAISSPLVRISGPFK